MKVRLGYVSISLNLQDSSTSKTITLSNLSKLEYPQLKLKTLLRDNLKNLIRILNYNIANNISVYRITSKLVPFATHSIASGWDYINDFKYDFEKIGKIIQDNNLRISAHPDHYTVLNTNSNEVLLNSLNDLEYHDKVFNTMKLDNNYKLVTHVGGKYDSKEKSLQRFIESFERLPFTVARRIILENDDKIYGISDVLNICQRINIPMVLDVHHHNCNNNNEILERYLDLIFDTWNKEENVPKIHFSSPKNQKNFRSHADNIDINEFIIFLKTAKIFDRDFDVMIEAKNKDLALSNLMDGLKQLDNIKILNQSSFEI